MKRIILIGNYQSDRQESMIRFAQLLLTGFSNAGLNCEIWHPKLFFGKLVKSTSSGAGKWLGYIDKWVLFPIILRYRISYKNLNNQNTHFHVCDHSNAPYLKYFPLLRTSITCHDVLAIRGALGYTDTYCTASGFGKILQHWICKNLIKAQKIICDSKMTLNQLRELKDKKVKNVKEDWRVVHIALNADFKFIERKECELLFKKAGIIFETPFILHVGSGHLRKNRKLLIDMVATLGNKWMGSICFAGEAVEPALMAHAYKLQLNNRVISIVSPDHQMLTALYSSCEAFIFPSFSEGFGWPLIEAQACGTPVIASNSEPMPEISGGAALHADPQDAEAFAEAFLSLQDPSLKSQLIEQGYINCNRYNTKRMIHSYMQSFNLEKL